MIEHSFTALLYFLYKAYIESFLFIWWYGYLSLSCLIKPFMP